jgi:hypothetical protein
MELADDTELAEDPEVLMPAPELPVEPETLPLKEPVLFLPPEEPDPGLATLPSGDPELSTFAVPPPSTDANVWGSTPTTASHPETMSPHKTSPHHLRISMFRSIARRLVEDPVAPGTHPWALQARALRRAPAGIDDNRMDAQGKKRERRPGDARSHAGDRAKRSSPPDRARTRQALTSSHGKRSRG